MIVFFEVKKTEQKYIKNKLSDVKFFSENIHDVPVSKFKDAEAISVFVWDKIDKELLDKLPKLKYIATRSTGYDHIDINECKKRGIKVSNVPNYGQNTVAEHTFALILSLSRKIPMTISRTKSGDFSLHGITGFDLKGKVLGVIGTGNIGEQVCRIANGFEMKTIAFDIKKNKDVKQYGVKYVSLDKLFELSDIITLHAPLNEHTKFMINSNAIKKMKKGVMIINTARGELIDTTALIKGLKNGKVCCAGLDVLENECYVKEEAQLLSKNIKACDLQVAIENNILLHRDDVLITPHNAFNSKEALMRITDTTIQNLKSYMNKKYINKVI